MRKISRKQIINGPFKGLYYVGESVGSSYFPKILGTYEKELHNLLDANKEENFDKVVVVGAGEGYYAAGLAKKWKRPVVAFEEDSKGRDLITRLSLINRVEIFIKGKFEATTDTQSKKDFVLMDIEGAEQDILTGKRFYDWKESVLLVEIHSEDIKNTLVERSKSTHNSFFTPVVERTMKDYPFDPPFPRLLKRWWWASIQEWRSDSIGWIIFEPKA